MGVIIEMKQYTSLTEGKVFSILVRFSIPFLLSSFLQALYGATDLFIVGQFSNSAVTSAVATGSQIMQTITGIILGITTGGTVLIGQYLGAKKEKDVAGAIGTIICIFSAIAFALLIIMVLLTNTIIRLMNTPKEAVIYARYYIFICSCGIPFIVGYNAVSGILRGLGDSKTPLIFIAIACIINFMFNFILVGLFNIGAAGSAVSTIFAQAISFLLEALFIKKRGFSFEFNRSYIKLDYIKAKNILNLGLPISLQDGLINVSFLLITAITNSMGLIASASVGIVEKIIVFAMLPASAFASAIAVITAQNMGAGKPARAQKSLYYGIGCTLIFGIICFVCSQLNPTLITSLFTTDKAVIKTAALYLKSYSLDCIMVSFVFCMNSFFSGSGHSLFPMLHSIITTFVIRIPVSFYFSKLPGTTLYQIGFASPLASSVSIIMCVFYLKSGRWKSNKIICMNN